jgi:aspartyl-tRNA(Asn)/glutamyl-tRNA(Gln) amidotransferase subunit C
MADSPTLTRADLDKICQACNLELSEQEAVQFLPQLSDVAGYMRQLEEIDTTGVEPTKDVGSQENVWREDVIEPSLSQEEALSGSSQTKAGFFRVKAIFEERTA